MIQAAHGPTMSAVIAPHTQDSFFTGSSAGSSFAGSKSSTGGSRIGRRMRPTIPHPLSPTSCEPCRKHWCYYNITPKFPKMLIFA